MNDFVKILSISILISFPYESVGQEYIVKVKKQDSKTYCYINLKGEKIFDNEYFECSDFSEFGCVVLPKSQGYDYKLIDKNGNTIETEVAIKPLFNSWNSSIIRFSDGMIRIGNGNKIGAMNYLGKLTVPIKFDELSEFNSNHAIGKIGKEYSIVHRNGKIIPIELEKIKDVKHFSEGLAVIRQGKLFGYIDTLGNVLIKPMYDGLGHFNDGLAWARTINGELGYIDKSGNWIIKPVFYAGKHYDKQSDMARVKTGNGWGYVNTKNEFNNFNLVGTIFSYNEGLAIKRDNEKVGYIDNTGKWAIQPIFDVAHEFKNGFARVEIDNNWGLINKQGEWILEPKYLEINDVIKMKR